MPYSDKTVRNAKCREAYRHKRDQEMREAGLDPALAQGHSKVIFKPRKDTSLPAELLHEMLPKVGETAEEHRKRRNRLKTNYYNSLMTPEERAEKNRKVRSSYDQRAEKIRARKKELYHSDKERFREYNLKYFEKNREKRLAKLKEWAKANPERRRDASRRWAKENREVFQAATAKCRAQILTAAPEWVDWKAIRKIYSKSANHNRDHPDDLWQVDHIIPLNHPDVCGLHVPHNLRIIPKRDNQIKGNRWLQEEGLAPMQED